jgi:hypothetical protein
MKKQPRLFPVFAALSLFLAAGPFPAVAQMRVQAGAGSSVVVPVALGIGGGIVPSAGPLWSLSTPIGLSAALAAPSVALSPLVSAVPAAAAPALALAPSAASASDEYSAAADEFPAPPQAPVPAAAPSPSETLRDSIWSRRIAPSAYADGALPRSRSRVKALILRTFLHMGQTFGHAGDDLPSSRGGYKIFHPFGTVLKIRYDALTGHSFTGLFADRGVPGLMRLSLALPPTSAAFIPGVAFKLFIDGRSSANAVFLNEKGLDGQQPDRNFFARSFTNVLPRPKGLAVKIAAFIVGLFNRFNALRIPVDALAAHHADGSPVDEPLAPYRLVLKPAAGLGNDPNNAKDFRVELGDLPVGPLFQVYASQTSQGPLVHVGDISAVSAPVASDYGDTGLFFQHRRVAP